MSRVDIVRAWKDAEYNESLGAEERASLPENPAGLVELTDAELATVTGAKWNSATTQCPVYTYCSSGCNSATIVCMP